MLAVRKERKSGGREKRHGAELAFLIQFPVRGFQLIISNQRASESRCVCLCVDLCVCPTTFPCLSLRALAFLLFVFGPPPTSPSIPYLCAGRAYIGFNIIFQSASARGHGLWTPVRFSVSYQEKKTGKERVQKHKAFKIIISNNCAGILRLMCSLLFRTWDSWLYKLSASHRLFPDMKHHLPGFLKAQHLSSILTTYVHQTLL